MLTKMRRTMMEDEAGQALVIGAFTLVVLTLSVMVTFQMGHAINKRIQLQGAVDNGAFSVATVVARSLNFIAFVNRAMIVHYVAMMAFTAIISTITGFRALLGMAHDLISTLSAVACLIGLACTLCIPVPFIGVACGICATAMKILAGVLAGIAKALEAAGTVMQNLEKAIDEPIATLAGEPIALLNSIGMYGAQLLMKGATAAALGSIAVPNSANFQSRVMDQTAGGPGLINTSGTISTVFKAGMGLMNGAASYLGMFDSGSDGIRDGGEFYKNSSENDQGNGISPRRIRADRLMTEITNATRTGTGRLKWETCRGIMGCAGDTSGVGGAISKAMSYLGIVHHGTARVVKPNNENQFRESSGAPIAIPDLGESPACKAAKPKCDNASNACTAAEQNAQQKDAAADQKEAQCAACAQPTCQACTDASSARTTANQAAADRSSKCNKARDECEKMQDKCQASKDGRNIGGVDLGSGGGKNNSFWNESSNPGGKSTLARGAVYQTSDFVKVSGIALISGGGAGRVVGIQVSSKNQHQFHCRYDGAIVVNVPSCPAPYRYTKPTKCTKESFHRWRGITHYLSFDIQNNPNTLFNQPNYWAMANMAPDKARVNANLAFGFTKSGDSFKVTGGGKTGELKNVNKPGVQAGTLGVGAFYGEGLNAYARSQVYYHRPNAWEEPPNFFNPFWRAKLAPVGPGLSAMLAKVGLSIPGALMPLVNTMLVH